MENALNVDALAELRRETTPICRGELGVEDLAKPLVRPNGESGCSMDGKK